ncbi:hypothetical protein ACFQJ7_16310 [Halovenus rubra]|uniref:Uncharacterized protein n=2 Tax=Halovenus rubra TaxID=869890 RepID=A0ABD5X8N4_9EURY|nr:hypothetical protein [Halovenus rubra]
MANPWDIDPENIPADSRTQRRRRRLQVVGLGLWGLFAGSITVLLVSSTESLTTAETASLLGLTLGTAVVAVVLGVLALLVLQYLPSIIAKFVFLFVFLAIFSLVLPQLVTLALDQLSLFEGVPVDTKQPLLDLIDSLLNENPRSR